MRMPDPNAPECDCGVLERLSKEPGVPIFYDPELNEYRIQTADGGRNTMMYHCFFCGGRLPKSRRDELFRHITTDEVIRLKMILKDITTLPDLLAALGPPDRDDPMGISTRAKAEDGGDRITYHRTLSYYSLSSTADVVASLNHEGQVAFSYWPKPLDEEVGVRL
jgi:hypothetical protein